ncbi:hypothetical protein VNO77_09414 [Canavalia gladiata]|uniref:porphobilinogen synthase n=1 Tax=Canavalia gladiata TaxID=3824 RepID=A0AAN9MD06_CANGL
MKTIDFQKRDNSILIFSCPFAIVFSFHHVHVVVSHVQNLLFGLQSTVQDWYMEMEMKRTEIILETQQRIVKPGLPYLDIIRLLRDNSPLSIAAYQVLGYYPRNCAFCYNAFDLLSNLSKLKFLN